jgi:hypothetical protein
VREAPKQTGVTMIPVFPTERMPVFTARSFPIFGIIPIPARPATADEMNLLRLIVFLTLKSFEFIFFAR